MTCIVGIEHEVGVLIGGDTIATSAWYQTTTAWYQTTISEKVFMVGPCVMGFAGSPRAAQLLRYKLTIPDIWMHDIDRWMATVFMDEVRTVFKDNESEFGKEGSGSSFLIGAAGRLYAVHSDYQFSRQVTNFYAIGSGREIATGSLHTTAKMNIEPKLRAEYALEAAAAHCGSVGGPFTIIDHQPERSWRD
jgi:ATP-dependent protease HslVU (ClpYQ) peptidase subunit